VKGIVIADRLERNSMVVQRPSAVLIRQAFADLPVGEYFSSEKSLEVKMAKPLPVDRIGTVMDATETGKETAANGRGSILGCHDASGHAERIMGPIASLRQGGPRIAALAH
jgi:hypothetical protein